MRMGKERLTKRLMSGSGWGGKDYTGEQDKWGAGGVNSGIYELGIKFKG